MSITSLSAVQDQICVALASGSTITAAAAEAGVHRNTITNWERSSIPFRRALARALYDRTRAVREEAHALASTALQTVRELLTDPKASASVRLKAALTILHEASTPLQGVVFLEATAPAPDFQEVHNSAQSSPAPYRREEPKVGRNEACPCGSGRKYKQCCLHKPVPLTPQVIPQANTSALESAS